jgi:hypothetical protein
MNGKIMRGFMVRSIFVVIAVLLLSACTLNKVSQELQAGSAPCNESRPEMCTMDYNPVCGSLPDGLFKTYSNACTACTDPNVNSYYPGECK